MKYLTHLLLALLISIQQISTINGVIWEVKYQKESTSYTKYVRNLIFIIDPYRQYTNEEYDDLTDTVYLSLIRLSNT